MDPLPVRQPRRLPPPRRRPRAPPGGAHAALLRTHRRLHQRYARHDERTGRARHRRPGPPVRGAQAVPRRHAGARCARDGGRRTPDARPAADPVPHPPAACQPAHGARPRPHRRRRCQRAADRDHRARHRRGPGGREPVRGRDPGPHVAAAPPAGARLRRRGGRRAAHAGPHRPPRVGRRDRGGRRGGQRPRHLRLGRAAHPVADRPCRCGGHGAGAGRRACPPAAGLLPDHRRGRARVAVRHRRRQAARARPGAIDPGAGARRPARRAGDAHRSRPGQALRREDGRPPRRAEGDRGARHRARAGRRRRVRARARRIRAARPA